MKFLTFILFILFSSVLFFTSCTKTVNNPVPTPITDTLLIKDTLVIKDTIVQKDLNPMVGYWMGTLTANNEPQAGALYYSFDIRADSTILTQSLGADGNTYYSEGTWTLSGSTFSATITSTTLPNKGVIENLSGNYDKNDGTLIGTWTTVGANAIGTFSLSRIN